MWRPFARRSGAARHDAAWAPDAHPVVSRPGRLPRRDRRTVPNLSCRAVVRSLLWRGVRVPQSQRDGDQAPMLRRAELLAVSEAAVLWPIPPLAKSCRVTGARAALAPAPGAADGGRPQCDADAAAVAADHGADGCRRAQRKLTYEMIGSQ